MNTTYGIELGAEGRKRILVIGGTGLVGAPIVAALDQAGWEVRVTSRKAAEASGRFGPRVQLVPGDANRPKDVERAAAGCRAVLICVSDLLDPYLDLRVTQNVVNLAPGLGIERIGLISGASVAEERRAFPMIDAKYQAEECLKASHIPWVIVRLTWLWESLARFVQGNRALVMGRQPAVIHPVAAADVGRMVCRAFERDDALGRTFTIHGPAGGTLTEWLTEYCARVQPRARVSSMPLWVLSVVAAIGRDPTLKAAVQLMKYFDGLPEFGDPTEANRLLGAPTLTLEQWAASPEAKAA